MDALTVVVGAVAIAGTAASWRTRSRALRAEAEVASLCDELQAERHAASHDALTGLPNRRAFYQLGATLVADPERHPLVAVVIDLDDFKQINDRLGHAAGDQVLITVARRLAMYAGDNLVARLGGDEFAGLLHTPTTDGRWLESARRRLTDALAAPIPVAECSVRVTASVGLVPVAGSAHLADALGDADAAMYRAKGTSPTVGPTSRSGHEVLCHPDVRTSARTLTLVPHHVAHWPSTGAPPPIPPYRLVGTTRGAEA